MEIEKQQSSHQNLDSTLAIDFETAPVGFFDQGKAGKTFLGHPRLAQATHVSWASIDAPEQADVTDRPNTAPALIDRSLVFHNAAFDLGVAMHSKLIVSLPDPAQIDCTRTMAKLLWSNQVCSLKGLAERLFKLEKLDRYQEVLTDESRFLDYAKRDAALTAKLFIELKQQLNTADLMTLYREVEINF